MNCPFCKKASSRVLVTVKFCSIVRRVRACRGCGGVWRTFELQAACPGCGSAPAESLVTNMGKFDATIQRTRRCDVCGAGFKTFEIIPDTYRWRGTIEPENIDEIQHVRRKSHWKKLKT